MSLPLAFHRAARAEFDDAADWYDQRRAGLGARFIDAVQHVLDQISTWPDYYPQVYKDVRETLVPTFPDCLYYREEASQVVVLPVFHTARDPSVWRDRA